MIYGSVCSGIEAATVAWHPLGWEAAFFSEIEKFPSAVLAHHYPDVPNLGDMTKFKEWPDANLDVLVGGTPCQSFSVAGLRKGLDDPRGNLMLTYLAIAERYRPKWVVWENVPGVLSSNGGRDFGTFLGALGKLGYGFAYRVLDAQYFGVAQRRRRVFVVGCLGDWRAAAAVLFERESMSGNPAPSREARQAVAALTANGVGTCGADDNQGQAGHLISSFSSDGYFGGMRESVACDPLRAKGGEALIAHTLRGDGFDASEDGTGRGTPLVPVQVASTLKANNGGGGFGSDPSETFIPVAFAENSRHEVRLEGGDGSCTGALSTGGGKPGQGVPMVAQAVSLRGREGGATAELGDEVSPALRCGGGGGDKPHVLTETADCLTSHWHNSNGAKAGNNAGVINPVINRMTVRRLTPRECERLQGFPDDYTLIPAYAKGSNKEDAEEVARWIMASDPCNWTIEEALKWAGHPDGPRYKALGNSMAAPVMRWIGKRIEAVNSLCIEVAA